MKTEAQKTLEELTENFNITDERIAVKLGVSSITIYRWRLGKFEPSSTELKLLQRILRGYKNAKWSL